MIIVIIILAAFDKSDTSCDPLAVIAAMGPLGSTQSNHSATLHQYTVHTTPLLHYYTVQTNFGENNIG